MGEVNGGSSSACETCGRYETFCVCEHEWEGEGGYSDATDIRYWQARAEQAEADAERLWDLVDRLSAWAPEHLRRHIGVARDMHREAVKARA